MDIICNQSFSLLEIYYRYGYMRKAKKILADDYEIYIFIPRKKNDHCSNAQGLGNMLNEESF